MQGHHACHAVTASRPHSVFAGTGVTRRMLRSDSKLYARARAPQRGLNAPARVTKLVARARHLQARAQRDKARPPADRNKVLQRQRGAHGKHARGQPRRHGVLAQAGEERGARERGRRRQHEPQREKVRGGRGCGAQAPLERPGAAGALCRAAGGQAAGSAPRGAPRLPEPRASRRCRAAGRQDVGLPALCTPRGRSVLRAAEACAAGYSKAQVCRTGSTSPRSK